MIGNEATKLSDAELAMSLSEPARAALQAFLERAMEHPELLELPHNRFLLDFVEQYHARLSAQRTLENQAAATAQNSEFVFFRLPVELQTIVLQFLSVPQLVTLSRTSKKLYAICNRNPVWCSHLKRRLWEPELDVEKVLPGGHPAPDCTWKQAYALLSVAEKETRVRRLLEDRSLLLNKLDDNIHRHFIGSSGWAVRYWVLSGNNLSAWDPESRRHRYTSFPIGPQAQIRPFSADQQRAAGVTAPMAHCFVIDNSSMNLIYGFNDQDRFNRWFKKISMTIEDQQKPADQRAQRY